MNQRTTLLVQMVGLLVVGGALGLYAYFGVFKKDAVEAEKKATDEHLFAVSKPADAPPDAGALKTEFTKLTITSKGEVTVLERAIGGSWRLVSPVQAPADALVLDTVTSQLQQARFKTTLEEDPTDAALTTYGLKQPEFSVEATAVIGNGPETKTVSLRGGIENTFDGSIYMQRDASKAVYLAEGGVRYALAKSTFDLRSKDVLAFDEAKAKSLTVTTKLNSYQLKRDEQNAWQVVKQPVTFPADATNVAAMLGSFRAEKAQAFLDDTPERRKALGLEPPRAEAVVELENENVRFAFGQPGGDAGSAAYVLRTDASGVTLAEVMPSAMGHLDRNPIDLRDKSLMVFKKEAVAKVVIHNVDGPEVIVEKESPDASLTDSWRVVAPTRGPAKTFKVTSILWALSTIRGSNFVAEGPKGANSLGLDGNARFIALFGGDGAELARFTIGKEVPKKPNIFYARGTRGVMELDGTRLTELPTRADELLDLPSADAGH